MKTALSIFPCVWLKHTKANCEILERIKGKEILLRTKQGKEGNLILFYSRRVPCWATTSRWLVAWGCCSQTRSSTGYLCGKSCIRDVTKSTFSMSYTLYVESTSHASYVSQGYLYVAKFLQNKNKFSQIDRQIDRLHLLPKISPAYF